MSIDTLRFSIHLDILIANSQIVIMLKCKFATRVVNKINFVNLHHKVEIAGNQ